MLQLTKVLVPVDFSERCLGAVRYAGAIARKFNSQIVLLHALEPLRYDFSTLEFGGTVMADFVRSRSEQARRQLDGLMAGELSDLSVERVLEEGDPAQRIVAYAREHNVDLIAMPTHGYGPFRRFILGSVTAKVLHDADCPVLTGVHMESRPASEVVPLRAVLCALDLGPQSRKITCWAAHFAQALGARLMLTHAVPCIETQPGEYFDRELAADLRRSAREELLKLRGALDYEVEVKVVSGDPPRAVCELAASSGADLLVIGRGSAAGVFGRLRTSAYSIIRESPCPVVSV
ncbi:MAG: universal stress protein [bacterium]|jgi:nucleotide-binding universal stress UspA family protein